MSKHKGKHKHHHKHHHKHDKWCALESSSHPIFGDDNQLAAQKAETFQFSKEDILIYDSENVEINTTDTKVGLSIQAALQA
ncbi:spore coat protein, partial [Priestia megaterium]